MRLSLQKKTVSESRNVHKAMLQVTQAQNIWQRDASLFKKRLLIFLAHLKSNKYYFDLLLVVI